MSRFEWFIGGVQIILAFAVGITTACQPAINARFASHTPSRIYGGIVNFAIGMLAILAVAALFRTPLPTAEKISAAPWWAWTGGILGAFFVTMSVILLPKMGAAIFFSLVIAGQLFGSAFIDHFGLLDVAVRQFTWGRGLGLTLMLAGMACIRWL